MNVDFGHINENIVNEAKNILRNLGYRLVDIEDQAGVNIGWRIIVL